MTTSVVAFNSGRRRWFLLYLEWLKILGKGTKRVRCSIIKII